MQRNVRVAGWLVQPSLGRITKAGLTVPVRAKVMDLLVYLAQHPGDAQAQLAETLRNLAAVTLHAGVSRDAAHRQDLLKVYVRDATLVPMIAQRLQEAFPGAAPIFLAGDICRRELLLEIECMHL